VLDRNGRVTSIQSPGKPETNEVPLLYPGVMLVSRTALGRLPSGPGEISDRLWQPALAEGRLGGALVSGHWREVGTPADYLHTVVDRLDGSLVVHPTAEVDPGASIGSALIGRDARVEAGAVVGDAVIAEGATVARGARVLRSVLLGDAKADPDELVVDQFRAFRT
jgi:NDP-sugar pyrophosphorylase family protein